MTELIDLLMLTLDIAESDAEELARLIFTEDGADEFEQF